MDFIFAIVFGLMVGSFLNVCIYRIPRNESIIFPRSHCTNCNHQIKSWENIPVISFLFLRGQCSNCKESISLRYPLIEIINAFLFAILYGQYGLTIDFIIAAFVSSTILIITVIDIDYLIIPNRLLLIGIIPASYMIISGGIQNSYQHFIGAFGLSMGILAIGMVGNIAFKKESMGMGDVKYAALIGLLFGMESWIACCFFSIFNFCLTHFDINAFW